METLILRIQYYSGMEEFISYIMHFGNPDKQAIDIIASKATELTLRKGEHFSEAGRIPKQVGFVVEGVIRGYYYDDKGDEITRCFISEGSLVADYVNFEANTPTSEFLQACTDCRLLLFSKHNWEDLSREIEGWDTIKNKMVQRCMYQKSRKGPVISQDATTRYMTFMKNYPAVINRVQLAHIASYLGVTQQSLSRIRKNIR
ncbi:cAMP-binding domain of CRP or a regulatory subunit of cAMP-dependent protein kinases [Chitinophaga jiangningensis]|uniref:cAMP-binding domain of CRP or a regulatory subunit of cAMP-dependent protein kinases n=1 Tax=Chitinophaga jiangningensis TaxID=1419482 RepID=A0A1M7M988_9BACT|nr:Crp/Fnr family transcriptional regulator [Chitinophaga jiangningensis]SHM86855.1 cAMP-binding domain of CRP or a regulatory subunit of cAMP-dependent protein kinases [Chitinophaga jiangningensis]